MRLESTCLSKSFLVLLLALAAPFAAAEYPDRAIRIVVPFAAGGGTDVMARMFGQKEYRKRLKRAALSP